jgi:transposase
VSWDDFSVYNGYSAANQQKCLAHIRRHFLGLVKCPGKENTSIGKVFVDLIDDVFDKYHSFQVSHDIKAYIEWATKFKSKLTNALNEWIPQAGATALNLLSKLRDKYDCWWYFQGPPQLPPDNNLAER